MSDDVEFSLGLNGDLSLVARKMASDVKALERELERLKTTSNRVDSGLMGRSKRAGGNELKALQDHERAIRSLRRSNLQGAPAMRQTGALLRTFGVHGATLRKFTVEAAKTELVLRRLYRLKGGGLRGAGAVVGSLASRAWNNGGRAAMGSAMWSGTKAAAGGALSLAAGGAMLAGGAALGGGGLLAYQLGGAAIEAERVKYALDAVTKGQGSSWWATASGYANDFGGNVSMIAENLMQMKASQFSDEMTKTLFLRTSDMRALGATDESIGRMLLAIRQIKAAGRLQGDELNQLGEAGLDASFVYDVLGKKLGKTRTEIIKLKEAGKLTDDIVIPAIAEAIGVKTGGKNAGEVGKAAASSTVAGAWGRLKGAWSVRASDSVDGGAMGGLRMGIVNFTNWLNGPGGEKTVGAFSGMLGRLFEAAPGIIDKVIWLLDTGIPAAIDGFKASLETSGAGSALNNMLEGFRGIAGPDGTGAAEGLRQIGSDVGILVGHLTTLCGWLVKTIGYLDSIGAKARYLSWLNPLTAPSKIGGQASDAGAVVRGSLLDSGQISGSISSSAAIMASPLLGPLAPAFGLGGWVRSLVGGGPALGTDVATSDMATSGGLNATLNAGIPRIEDAARTAVVSQIPKMAAPIVNQNNVINVTGADAASPEAIAAASSDRSERGLTSLFSQLGYSLG